MKCNLCLEEKSLIKKSHIIPDFMYKGLFDSKHRITYRNSINPQNYKSLFDGIYDQYILCKKCDNEIIGKLETYSSIMIFGGNLNAISLPEFSKVKNKSGLVSVNIENIDYNKFKLFLLSILWRAHLSKHKFFSEINLGIHGENIRKMIINEDGGDESKYETAIAILKSKSLKPFKSIIQPIKIKVKNNTFYIFYINGIMYHFNISPINKMEVFEKGRISKENKMAVALLEEGIADHYFESYLGNLKP